MMRMAFFIPPTIRITGILFVPRVTILIKKEFISCAV
jgi:hypothetical protein